jgi:alcohol dehydrogenase (cytochrome c)
MLYFQVGNAWPDYDGAPRGGDNLFTASVVALDYKTGKYRWHFQEVHHEIWDYDAANAPILFNTTKDGQARKVIAHPGKTGWVYFLDRANGEPLVGIEERPVPQDRRHKTAATQPYPVGDAFINQCAPDPLPGYQTACIFGTFGELPVLMSPGPGGGSDYAPISYSPQTDLVYVPATVQNSAFTVRTETLDPVTGKRVNLTGAGVYTPLGTKFSGSLTAIRPQTNTIAWQKPMPYKMGASTGVLTTAGGLLFVGQADGNFLAFDAKTGDELWRFQTGFGAEATPMSYEIDGVQYISIATGGNRTNNSQRSDVVWSFSVNGKLGPLPAPAKTGLKEQQFLNTAAVKNQKSVSIGRVWNNADAKLDQKSEYNYGPDNILVPVGTTVTFTNEGEVAHTVTDQKNNFDTDLIQAGDSASVTFNTPGTYIYFCVPHPWMIAQVVVE